MTDMNMTLQVEVNTLEEVKELRRELEKIRDLKKEIKQLDENKNPVLTEQNATAEVEGDGEAKFVTSDENTLATTQFRI